MGDGDTWRNSEMPVRVKVNTRSSDELFAKMGWTLKNSLPGYLRQEARLVAVSLAIQTQPFGSSATSQAVGQVATSRDIYRVYTTPGKAFSDVQNARAQAGFWKAVKSSAWDRAEKILRRSGNALKFTTIDNFDGGARHRQLRNNQGRIPPSQKPVMIVRNPSALKTYIKAEMKKVGFGKGGWSACARALGGTRGIPGWVSRQDSPGTVVESYKEERSWIRLTNDVPYADKILSLAQKEEAIAIAMDRLRKSVLIALRFSPR